MVAGTSCLKELGTLGWQRETKQRSAPAGGGTEKESRSGTWILALLGTRRCVRFFR